MTLDKQTNLELRSLPSVHELLLHDSLQPYSDTIARDVLIEVIRTELEVTRARIISGNGPLAGDVTERIRNAIRDLVEPASTIVVNGTGVVIHTNLGRAPVSTATAKAMAAHAERYQALELQLSTGKRGGRGARISRLMRLLTGAEKTLVVNNNAAAVLLTLAATTAGREVVVSRGEAVEIGGGFRIPDVLAQSGASLVEVGTTNRTYRRDYERATNDQTAAYLKVHASNFSMSGFTSSATLADLASLAQERNVMLIEDVGSGCLIDTRKFGLAYEPTLGASIAAGVDVLCASGDKLLGGPQAGIITGRAEIVDRIAAHPLARAVRADKSCLAGIDMTLRHYVQNEAEEQVPVWWAISRSTDWLEQRIAGWLGALGTEHARSRAVKSVIGGGSLPGMTLPSHAMVLDLPGYTAEQTARRLRTGTPAVMPRIVDDLVAIDARSVLKDEDEHVLKAVKSLLR
jgi:L-seryl-tRNA(Ser) seleniumtransferase